MGVVAHGLQRRAQRRLPAAQPGAHQNEVFSYYTGDRIPFLTRSAREFTICDRWFSSVMGPTWPNRFYLHAATADGHKTTGRWA
jgi:phospholipase C